MAFWRNVYRSDNGGHHWYYAFSVQTTFDPTNASAVVGYGPVGSRLLIAYEYGRDTINAAIHVYWLDLDTDEDGLITIEATILVERQTQRQIVIGRAGQLLKQVGTAARLELERLLGSRVFLRLWVKVREDWRNDERTLRELGLR